MHNTLQKIIAKTKEEVEKRKKKEKRFQKAMLSPKKGKLALIAEIKLASPSEPYLGSENDLIERAKAYEEAGADAVSIVTEKHFFKGDPLFVVKIKESVGIPVLQKDFVVDEYQIYEAKKLGADALLLIARLVDKKALKHFVKLCFAEGIDPVVEVHNAEDLERALATPTSIIAVNARDLDTMDVSIDRACELLGKVPEQFIKLGFSGIKTKEDVEKYKEVEVSGVLVGTALMKTQNIQEFLGGLR